MFRWKKTVCVLIGLALFGMALSGCRHAPDEAQVREAIASIAQAAEAGTASDVVAPLSDDFDGNAGELDRRVLANMVRLMTLRGEHIGVLIGPVGLEHHGERMVATFTVTLTSSGHTIPEQWGVYRIGSAWRKEHGKWRCYSASWKPSL